MTTETPTKPRSVNTLDGTTGKAIVEPPAAPDQRSRPILLPDDLNAYRIPAVDEFVRTKNGEPVQALGGQDQLEQCDYIAAYGLEKIARAIVAKHPDSFAHLDLKLVRFRWKKTGGENSGAMVFGKCRKLTDALADVLPGKAWLIWLAADNCLDAGFDSYDVEVTLAHELLHTGRNEKGKPTTLPHPVEEFPETVAWYGLHSNELRVLAEVIKQVPDGLGQSQQPTMFDED